MTPPFLHLAVLLRTCLIAAGKANQRSLDQRQIGDPPPLRRHIQIRPACALKSYRPCTIAVLHCPFNEVISKCWKRGDDRLAFFFP